MKIRNHIIQFQDQSVEASSPLVDKAIHLAVAGDYEQALRTLSKGSSLSQEVLNARGVFFMRLGRPADAVRVFRSLVLPSGCTWMKPELPVIYRTNFATALLLAGLPLGVRATLNEIPEKDHPSVLRLREAVCFWEQNLTWWQRCGWRIGYAPSVPMRISFVPGEFVDPLSTPVTPAPTDPTVTNTSVQQVA